MTQPEPSPVIGRHPNTRIILGPPGTGKTTRLMTLLEAEIADGVAPEAIGFVSFTKAAVTEAKDRAVAKFALDPERFDGFRTIHSQAYALIGREKQPMKSSDWRAFCDRYRYQLSEADPKNAEEPGQSPQNTDDDQLRAAHEWSRVRLVSIREGLRTYQGAVRADDVELFATRYAQFKVDTKRIDFTDMLEQCLRRGLARRRKVLFIDEVQDLSPLQIALVKLWMAESERVYIAGDDDQAIYTFGGAEPDWLIELAKIHPVDVLDRSWRCPRDPHALAMKVIGRNRRRVAKPYSPREEVGSVSVASREGAIAAIRSGESTFVLCRNVRTIRSIVGDLFHARIAYLSERGGLNPLGRASLLAAVNAAISLGAGLNVPNSALKNLGEYVAAPLFGPRGTKGTIMARADLDPDEVDEWPIGVLREAIRSRGPVAILTLGKVDDETREYLAAVIAKHGKVPIPEVIVTTIHGSKGREAQHVIVFSDVAFPVASSMRDDPEPENRAAYVAVTRTRDRLTIVRPETKHFYAYPLAGA